MKKKASILFCILVVIGGIFMLLPKLQGLRFRNDELESCRTSTGGGMLGGYSEYCLKRNENGEAVLEVRYKETHADRELIDIYKAGEEEFDHIRKLVNDHDLFAASKRRYRKARVLDGDTTSVSFSYSKDYFSISEEQVLSVGMRKGFAEVRDLLFSLATGECESYLEPQEARILIKGYNLRYIVEDAFDGKLDGLLSVEREVSRFGECGITVSSGEAPDVSEAAPSGGAASAGSMVYDSKSGCIVLLYEDCEFDGPYYLLAKLDGYVDSARPLIKEMEGPYRFYLN